MKSRNLTIEEAESLIKFMASFFWNCSTEESFEKKTADREAEILRHFLETTDTRGANLVLSAYNSAATIQSGDPWKVER